LFALLSILAALASAKDGQDQRARLQQVSGRLGLNKKKDAPRGAAGRLEYALQRNPKLRTGFPLLDFIQLIRGLGVDPNSTTPNRMDWVVGWAARHEWATRLPPPQDITLVRDWLWGDDNPGDVQAMDWDQAVVQAASWHDELAKQEGGGSLIPPGKVILEWPDGMTLHWLTDPSNPTWPSVPGYPSHEIRNLVHDEGVSMQHCLSDGYYDDAVDRREVQIFSLRRRSPYSVGPKAGWATPVVSFAMRTQTLEDRAMMAAANEPLFWQFLDQSGILDQEGARVAFPKSHDAFSHLVEQEESLRESVSDARLEGDEDSWISGDQDERDARLLGNVDLYGIWVLDPDTLSDFLITAEGLYLEEAWFSWMEERHPETARMYTMVDWVEIKGRQNRPPAPKYQDKAKQFIRWATTHPLIGNRRPEEISTAGGPEAFFLWRPGDAEWMDAWSNSGFSAQQPTRDLPLQPNGKKHGLSLTTARYSPGSDILGPPSLEPVSLAWPLLTRSHPRRSPEISYLIRAFSGRDYGIKDMTYEQLVALLGGQEALQLGVDILSERSPELAVELLTEMERSGARGRTKIAPDALRAYVDEIASSMLSSASHLEAGFLHHRQGLGQGQMELDKLKRAGLFDPSQQAQEQIKAAHLLGAEVEPAWALRVALGSDDMARLKALPSVLENTFSWMVEPRSMWLENADLLKQDPNISFLWDDTGRRKVPPIRTRGLYRPSQISRFRSVHLLSAAFMALLVKGVTPAELAPIARLLFSCLGFVTAFLETASVFRDEGIIGLDEAILALFGAFQVASEQSMKTHPGERRQWLTVNNYLDLLIGSEHPRDLVGAARSEALLSPYWALDFAIAVDQAPREDTRASASRKADTAIQYAKRVDMGLHPITRATVLADWGTTEAGIWNDSEVDLPPTVAGKVKWVLDRISPARTSPPGAINEAPDRQIFSLPPNPSELEIKRWFDALARDELGATLTSFFQSEEEARSTLVSLDLPLSQLEAGLYVMPAHRPVILRDGLRWLFFPKGAVELLSSDTFAKATGTIRIPWLHPKLDEAPRSGEPTLFSLSFDLPGDEL